MTVERTYRTWQEALNDCNVQDDWLNELEDWPEWAWPHLTDDMVNREQALPFRLVYAVLVERSGLPMPTRALLQHLARRCGGTNGKPRRCWPKLATIADRVGASRRSVQYAIRNAEETGWLVVVRHTKRPSDYLLDVPNYVTCPCLDCAEGADIAPQGADIAPLEDADAAPQGADIAHALGSEHLVQALNADHLRGPSDDGSAGDGRFKLQQQGRQEQESLEKPDPQEQPDSADDAYRYGETLRKYAEQSDGFGHIDAIECFEKTERLLPYRREFMAGLNGLERHQDQVMPV